MEGKEVGRRGCVLSVAIECILGPRDAQEVH